MNLTINSNDIAFSHRLIDWLSKQTVEPDSTTLRLHKDTAIENEEEGYYWKRFAEWCEENTIDLLEEHEAFSRQLWDCWIAAITYVRYIEQNKIAR